MFSFESRRCVVFAIFQLSPSSSTSISGPTSAADRSRYPARKRSGRRVFTGEDTAQKFVLLQVRAVGKNGRGCQRADAHLGGTDDAGGVELVVDDGHETDRKVAAMPASRPVRRAPKPEWMRFCCAG